MLVVPVHSDRAGKPSQHWTQLPEERHSQFTLPLAKIKLLEGGSPRSSCFLTLFSHRLYRRRKNCYFWLSGWVWIVRHNGWAGYTQALHGQDHRHICVLMHCGTVVVLMMAAFIGSNK
jgi:hypothetical protein